MRNKIQPWELESQV